jgi:peptide/nickel transport system ATP-binding protein
MTTPVLSVDGLTVAIGGATVVDGLSLHIGPGETLALVGESGCGKSLTALALMRLLPDAATIAAGCVVLDGDDLAALPEPAMNRLRGARLSMIFQEPVASLDPLMRVGAQVAGSLRAHRQISRADADAEALRMFRAVGIPEPEVRLRQYPHELSGGMCQRVMIAMALIGSPALLIADEPTTALDVTIQAQILDLMRRLREETGTAVLLITHDMGVVAEVADRMAVMYAGRIVETGPVAEVFANPRHPYTHLLLRTIPRLDGPRKAALPAIRGRVPDIGQWGEGCRFHARCPLAIGRCRVALPPLEGDRHRAACFRSADVAGMAGVSA